MNKALGARTQRRRCSARCSAGQHSVVSSELAQPPLRTASVTHHCLSEAVLLSPGCCWPLVRREKGHVLSTERHKSQVQREG